MKRNDIITTPRTLEIRQQKKRAFIVRSAFVSGLALVAFTGLICLSRLRTIRIYNVMVDGTRVIDASLVREKVLSDLAGYYLWVIPKNNAFFYPKQKILADLQDDFPRIKDIGITRNGFKELAITVAERNSQSLWCGDTFPEPDGMPCYFMDDTGFIFTEAPYFSGNIYFKWYGGNTTPNNPVKTSILTQKQVESLSRFIASVENLGLKVYALVIKTDGNCELYMLQPNTVGTKILFRVSDDLEKISQNLFVAFTADTFKALKDKNFVGIGYVDLRYDNKIYYK